MTVPDFLPVLSAGAHASPREGACILEYVALLAGEPWSDSPSCTHPVLARAAQITNDRLPDGERQRLVPLIGRLFGTAPSGSAEDRKRLSVGLAVWCARRVLPADADPRSVAAVEAAAGWLAGRTTEQECHAAASAAPVASAAASAAAYAAVAASDARADARAAAARAAAARAAAAEADADPVGFLAGLLDEYDRLTGRTEHYALTPTDLANLARKVTHS